MTARTRALLAVGVAAILVGVLVVASGRLPRRWHVVLVDVSAAVVVSPDATPRLDALRDAGIGVTWPQGWLPDAPELEQLSEGLSARGWEHVEVPSASGARETTDAALDAAYAAGPAGERRLLEVVYRPASRAELDLEVGRLLDGLAGPMPPSRTLFVILDREVHTAIIGGPRNFVPASVPAHGTGPGDFTPWVLGILRVE